MAAANKIIKLQEAAQKRVEQRAETKVELANHAIAALAELGYARTSMRDIAAQSQRSIGALNYYFEDKSDLISYCVRIYKQDFVRQIDEIIAGATSRETLVNNFIAGFVQTLDEEAITHRLWYDIRSQSLFDDGFHNVVVEIEQALIDMVGRLLRGIDRADKNERETYYLLDSSFRYHLQLRLQNSPNALNLFKDELTTILA